MEYNTKREHIKVPEYGRNIQSMVRQAIEIQDRAERTRAAHSIINTMTFIMPQQQGKETEESKQKLWAHLFLISEYKLDVDGPYPMERVEMQTTKLQKPSYGNNLIRFRHYGKGTDKMIAHAITMEESPERDAFINSIAAYMKLSYLQWRDDKVPDAVIINQLREMSGGKINIDSFTDTITHILDMPGKFNPLQKKFGASSGQNQQGQKRNFQKAAPNKQFQRKGGRY